MGSVRVVPGCIALWSSSIDGSGSPPVSTSLWPAGRSYREEFGLQEHSELLHSMSQSLWMPSRPGARTEWDLATDVYCMYSLSLPCNCKKWLRLNNQRFYPGCHSASYGSHVNTTVKLSDGSHLGSPQPRPQQPAWSLPLACSVLTTVEVKAPVSRAGQEYHAVRDPVTTPAVHLHCHE